MDPAILQDVSKQVLLSFVHILDSDPRRVLGIVQVQICARHILGGQFRNGIQLVY